MNPILTAAKQLLHKEEKILSTLKCSLTGYMITHKVRILACYLLLIKDFSF